MSMNLPPTSAPVERGTSVLRRQNREWILSLIAQNSPVTRGKLAEETGLTGAAVSRITRELIDAGIVMEGDPIATPGRVGRREYEISINPSGAYVLGLSITANRRSICLADATGTVLRSVDCNDIPVGDASEFLSAICERIKSLVFDVNFDINRLLGLGVSAVFSFGPDEPNTDGLLTSEPLGWVNFPVHSFLADALKMEVRVEHRASAILRGELQSVPSLEDIVLVNVAWGIGISARLGDRFLVNDSKGFGALSHYRIPHSDVACSCGRTGCLEVMGSGKAVLRTLDLSPTRSDDISERLTEAIDAADEGDSASRAAFREAGANIALGIDAILALMKPNRVIVAGEVGRQDDFYNGLMDYLLEHNPAMSENQVLRSSISSEAAAVSVGQHGFLFSSSLDVGKLTSTR